MDTTGRPPGFQLKQSVDGRPRKVPFIQHLEHSGVRVTENLPEDGQQDSSYDATANNTLVPTRKGDAPLVAIQRERRGR